MNIRTIAVVTIAVPVLSIIGHAVLKREVAPRIANTTVTITTGAPTSPGLASPEASERLAARRSGRDAIPVRAVARRPVAAENRLTPLAQADDARWR
jgi:hypothetical protein